MFAQLAAPGEYLRSPNFFNIDFGITVDDDDDDDDDDDVAAVILLRNVQLPSSSLYIDDWPECDEHDELEVTGLEDNISGSE